MSDAQTVFAAEIHLSLPLETAEVLMACLRALEDVVQPDEPLGHALASLRPMRSALLEQWLQAKLRNQDRPTGA